jgi:hypothetical protein
MNVFFTKEVTGGNPLLMEQEHAYLQKKNNYLKIILLLQVQRLMSSFSVTMYSCQ